MEELQEKITGLTSEKDARYFYHFTHEFGDKILDEGLIVASKIWEESFLEFTESELQNIVLVIADNPSNKVKHNNTMILAGVYKDSMSSFIRPLSEDEGYDVDWEGVGNPDYIVDNCHLIGYIDLTTLELVVNERANVCGDFYDL